MILKLQFGDDLRRVVIETLSLADLRALCVKSFNTRDFSLKYVDPEGDKVTITDDDDLREALRLSASTPLRVLIIAREVPSPAPSQPEAPGIGDLSDLFSKLGLNGVAPNLPTLARQLRDFLPQEEISKLPLFLQQLLSSFQSEESRPDRSPAECSRPSNCGPLHPNIICDGCEGPVIGTRFKCSVCLDFDFCQECHARRSHAHPFRPIPSPAASDARPAHHGVRCDGCQVSPITGKRFKCTVCWNFDLCESCEASGVHHPEHPLIKIARPQAQGHGPFGGAGPCRGRGGFRRFARSQCRPMPTRLVANYLEDVTIPDGSILVAGTKFLKVWKLKNEGGEAWPNGCKLVFLGGDNLSAQENVPVESTPPGGEVNVAVEMTAPARPGRFSSYWRLEDPDGNRFGQRIWVDLFVAANSEPAPAPTPAPVPVPEPSAPAAPSWTPEQQSAIQTLQGMGYPLDVIDHAFEAANGDVAVVLQALLL
jgi:hypothetical protein